MDCAGESVGVNSGIATGPDTGQAPRRTATTVTASVSRSASIDDVPAATRNVLVCSPEGCCATFPDSGRALWLQRSPTAMVTGAQPRPFPHQVGGHGALALHGAGLVKKPLVERELAFYEYVWGELVDAFESLDGSSEDWAVRRELVAPLSPRKLERLLSFETRQRALANLREKLQYRRMREERCCAGCRQALPAEVATLQQVTCPCQMRFSNEAIESLREFTARYYGIVSLSRVRGEWRYNHEHPSNHPEEVHRNACSERSTSVLPDAAVRRTPANADDTQELHELWFAENGKALDVNPWARVCFERSFAPHRNERDTPSGHDEDSRHAVDRSGVADAIKAGASGSDAEETVLHEFLVLEDLTFPFRYPSVLDVKVGTRDYDDEASEEKRRRHIEKCRMTTSATYGVRLTGMQVFQPERHTYLCHDKYHGRRLKDEEQLLDELTQYLDNGERSRTAARRAVQVANSFRTRLERLRSFVAGQDEWRFYSSSLLFIYEGDSAIDLDAQSPASTGSATSTIPQTRLIEPAANGSSNSNSALVCMKMIDFAHTQRSNCQDAPNDDGYLLGIETMIRLFFNVAQRFAEREDEWQTQADSDKVRRS